MNKIILFLLLLFSICKFSFGQNSNEKTIFIVDSILVDNDPESEDAILQTDVADIRVIKNKDTLNRLGYGQFDGATFIFTKEYRNRPDSLKQILSSKQMKKKSGIWFYRDTPYTGRFIDYYYSGRKQGEGILVNGKVNGLRMIYYQSGKIKVEKNYKDGLGNGSNEEYYEDGSLKEKGEFIDGKEEGFWDNYYPNGQVKLHGNYRNGEIFDTAIKYYSTGKIKEKVFIKGNKVTPDPNLVKINQLMSKSQASNKEGDTKAAIKYCNKAIELDSTFADAYFSRGTIKLNDFQFDDAIADFDKALHLEPYMDAALANRAFTRIRKYQFANSRTLSKNNDVTVMASKDKVSVPADEQEKICYDLQRAVFLGSKSEMITEALSNYCQTKSN